MADFLSPAEWKKNVNSLLGLLHKKTGLTEALTKYDALRKLPKTPPDPKVESLDLVLKAIAKTAEGHKNNKKAQEYLTSMKAQAAKARSDAAGVSELFGKGCAYKEMLGNTTLWPFFMEFCKKEDSAESLDYWLAMRKDPDFARAELLVRDYLDSKGKKLLNLKPEANQKAQAILKNGELSKEEKLKQLTVVLKKVVTEVEVNMADTWTRFQFSDEYIRMVAKYRGFKSWV